MCAYSGQYGTLKMYSLTPPILARDYIVRSLRQVCSQYFYPYAGDCD